MKMKNRKGFAVSAPMMGIVMFLIVAGVAYFIISEDEQQTASVPEDNQLIFISQSIQADYYNTLLQNTLEAETVRFLEEEQHRIDPDANFMTNLGDGLRRALEGPLNEIVNRDVSSTYAEAYSRREGIDCEARVSAGGYVSFVTLTLQEDGSLIVNAVTTGQEIRCTSQEPATSTVVNLEARGYQIGVRVGEYHDLAIAAIKGANAQLDVIAGHVVGDAWKLPDDQNAKAAVKANWDAMTRSIYGLGGGPEDLYVEPGSILVRSRDGDPYTIDELTYACDGSVGYEQRRNCRPDDLTVTIGEEGCEDDQEEVDVTAQVQNVEIEANVVGVGFTFVIPKEILEQALGKLTDKLEDAVAAGLDKACLDYESSTKICRDFVGKPSSASIQGVILEEGQGFIPAGIEAPIVFNFESYGFDIDDSMIEDDLDCGSEEGREVVFENIKALLAKGDFKMQFNYEGDKATIKDLDQVAQKINEDRMYSDLGDEIILNAKGRVTDENGQEVLVAQSTAGGKSQRGTQATNIIGTQTAPTSGPWGQQIASGFQQTSASQGGDQQYKAYQSLYDLLDTGAGTAYQAGQPGASSILSKDAASICKLMGLKNLLDMGDYEAAMAAICGISKLGDFEDLDAVCNLGALFKVKSPEGLARALKNLFGAIVSAELLEGLSLPEALLAAGLPDMAGLIEAVQAADVRGALKAAADMLARLGEIDAANLLIGAMNLDAAIEAGNIEAAISAITDIGRILGLEGLAEIGAVAGNIAGIADLITDFDNLVAKCEDEPPWDIACVPAGSSVCPPAVEDCSFTYGLPTFDFGLLCNDFVLDGGFQADCECVYFCPEGVKVPLYLKPTPFTGYYYMDLTTRIQVGDIIAGLDLPAVDALAGLESIFYCKFDP